jgi:hypothetical protein
MERDKMICELLAQMISQEESGRVDPSCTQKWRLLRKYIEPNGLKSFIERHDQFEVYPHTPNKWKFGFARSRDCVSPGHTGKSSSSTALPGHENHAHRDETFDPKHFFACFPED